MTQMVCLKTLRTDIMIRYFGLIVAVLFLTQCQTAKEKGSAMSEFFKAIGSGDTSVLKKFKKSKEQDDGSWDEVEGTTK